MRIKDLLVVGVILAIHGTLGWLLLLVATKSNNPYLSWALPLLYGVFSGLIFLYIFNHDKVIKIARIIEEKEEKIEEKWLKHFARSGKFITVFLMGMVGGPVLAALTVHLLLRRFRHKYILVTIIIVLNTIFYIGFLKGTLGLVI